MTSSNPSKPATMIPDLLDCDALMLSSYLLHHRFDGDAMETATFLLEATSTLPNSEAISAQLMLSGEATGGERKEEKESVAAVPINASVTDDLGSVLAEECTVSMITPRGKFQLVLYAQGIRCTNAKKQTLTIIPDNVERMVMFPKPEDCRATSKPSGGDLVLLCLSSESSSLTTTTFNDKVLTQVCFQLPKDSPTEDSSWLDLLCSSLSLSKHQLALVQHPKNKNRSNHHYVFKSHDEGTTSSTTAGMPYVQCYHGVKDGVLYPMQEGLLFFKPPLFLHRSMLHSIACGRGSGGSRYVDLSVVLLGEEETPIEFTNIHRDELQHLNDYIHSTLIPAMKRDAEAGDGESENTMEEENVKEEESNSALGKRKRTQRKASKEARQATKAAMERTQEEEDSDDDDEGWEGKEVEDESDEEEDEEDAERETAGTNNDDDDESEEEFFEEQGSATESDEDNK